MDASDFDRPLRKGWTTGACATAAACAAYEALLGGEFPDPVTITLPGGQQPSFALAQQSLESSSARASVIKDAGDDPDVTHNAEIISTIRKSPHKGLIFKAGDGVGTVTRPGLQLEVGEAAINPAPRAMMEANLTRIAERHGVDLALEVEVSVPGGQALAEKTMNPRLGILGGISILGTTGIVVPYSCSAWIHSIHRGVDVARAAGLPHLAACTGSVSERTLRRQLDLPDPAWIDMGDFAGGLLKYLRKHPVEQLTIGGGFAKLCKLADGAMDLHSARSKVDFTSLASRLEALEAPQTLVEEARTANTALQVLTASREAGLPLADVIAGAARERVLNITDGKITAEIYVIDRKGSIVGHA